MKVYVCELCGGEIDREPCVLDIDVMLPGRHHTDCPAQAPVSAASTRKQP